MNRMLEPDLSNYVVLDALGIRRVTRKKLYPILVIKIFQISFLLFHTTTICILQVIDLAKKARGITEAKRKFPSALCSRGLGIAIRRTFFFINFPTIKLL